jgi:hypothetical protein
MSINALSSARRQILAGAFSLAAFAALAGAAAAAENQQSWTIKAGSVEERLHESNGRQTNLEIARGRLSDREIAARVRDERSGWSYAQWDAYARSMRGK